MNGLVARGVRCSSWHRQLLLGPVATAPPSAASNYPRQGPAPAMSTGTVGGTVRTRPTSLGTVAGVAAKASEVRIQGSPTLGDGDCPRTGLSGLHADCLAPFRRSPRERGQPRIVHCWFSGRVRIDGLGLPAIRHGQSGVLAICPHDGWPSVAADTVPRDSRLSKTVPLTVPLNIVNAAVSE